MSGSNGYHMMQWRSMAGGGMASVTRYHVTRRRGDDICGRPLHVYLPSSAEGALTTCHPSGFLFVSHIPVPTIVHIHVSSRPLLLHPPCVTLVCAQEHPGDARRPHEHAGGANPWRKPDINGKRKNAKVREVRAYYPE